MTLLRNHSCRETNLSCCGFSLGVFQNPKGGIHHFLIHLAVASGGFGERNGDNFVATKGGHFAKFSAVDHVYGAQPIARCEHAVESSRRSAALNVPKHDSA